MKKKVVQHDNALGLLKNDLCRTTTISQTNLSFLESTLYSCFVLTYFKTESLETIQVLSGFEELTDSPLKTAHVCI